MKAFPVAILCEVMRVSRSGFYDYLFRYLDDNGPGEAELKSRIKEIFNNSGHSYGSRRIVKQLQAEGHQIGRYKGRHIMRQLNLKAITPKRFKRTTDSKHSWEQKKRIELADHRDQVKKLQQNSITINLRICLFVMIGYLPLGQQGSNLFFQVISQRHQLKSTIITTNLPFSDWGKLFDSTTVATAIADHLVYNSHVLILEGSSYRKKSKPAE